MKSWFENAKRIESIETEICFLLNGELFLWADSTRGEIEESLSPPEFQRHLPSMARSSEICGNEPELIRYYNDIIRIARKNRLAFNDIRQYFWMRLWLWNTAEKIHIGFPWYDTYSEMDHFFTSISVDSEGELFSDVDQGWELEVHELNGDLYIRWLEPSNEPHHREIRLPKETLIEQVRLIRQRMNSILKILSDAIGKDVWTNRCGWPELLGDDEPTPPPKARPWWKFW